MPNNAVSEAARLMRAAAGSKPGLARAANLSKRRLVEIARMGVKARFTGMTKAQRSAAMRRVALERWARREKKSKS